MTMYLSTCCLRVSCSRVRIVLLNVIVLILATNFVYAGEAPPYRLIDSGFPANEQFQPYWIDNERIIFKGYEVGSYSKEMHGSPLSVTHARGYDEHGMHTGYYIWDTKTNNVSLYKDKIANLCVEDGRVVYQANPSTDGEKPVVWRGKFGEEQPINTAPPAWTFYGRTASCWDIAYIRTEAQKGRHVLRLRPGWGYLDVGPSDPPRDPNAPVMYYRANEKEPIRLPIPRSKLWNGGYVVFVPHDGLHLIVEGTSKVPEAWFLASDGRVVEVILPSGPWRSVTLHSVRGGIFLSSAFTRGKKLSEPPGAYLIPDGQWWRLLFTGVQGHAGVSPNGCKVAMTVTPDEKALRETFTEWKAGRPGQKTMRMIDICQGDKK